MHITDHINAAGSRIPISIEVIPPHKDTYHIDGLFSVVSQFNAFNLSFVSVTSHAHERIIEKHGDKLIERIKRKRLDTNTICIAIKDRLNIDTAPHLICAGFSKDETEDALYNMHLHGIENIIALQGDYMPPQIDNYPYERLFNTRASDIVEQIVAMNKGANLDGIVGKVKTNFCIGVAGYPEKHFSAPSLEKDIYYLKEKVEKGAHFIVTQMFFDNDYYYRFVDRARRAGIKIPIIPGIKPIYKKTQIPLLTNKFYLSLPKHLIKLLQESNSDEDAQKIGIDHCIKQCKELIQYGVPSLHFYTMSSINPVVQILQGLDLS